MAHFLNEVQKAVSGGKICGLTLDCVHDIEIVYLKSQTNLKVVCKNIG